MLSEATINVAAPISLADYTRPALIVPRLRERDTAGIISELSQALQREGCVPDVLPFYQAALNQELLTNSALDCGLAFPHARLGGIKRLQFAFGRTPEPIVWGAKSAWPVQFIFLLAVPATDAAGLSAPAGQPRPARVNNPSTWPNSAGRRASKPFWLRSSKSGCGRDELEQ